jgi:hypothetical protein
MNERRLTENMESVIVIMGRGTRLLYHRQVMGMGCYYKLGEEIKLNIQTAEGLIDRGLVAYERKLNPICSEYQLTAAGLCAAIILTARDKETANV